ncbi:MAG: YlmC/YmxH family sporulation protein [Clostridia bacterium]|nr:YlmC/YmxH family sporulation protein [Clostridia bacterium]MDD7671674.1 YlmC/YmxH family sporulation protein [Clostridia bacterium]MDY2928903.1 YlmC/YmxH family sporulation protein [Clostridiaceae bacterium]
METRMGELGYKEVIDLDTGQRLGYVRDALVDSETGRVRALIIPGRLRCLGLLGRGPELTLPWESISRLGEDYLLVRGVSAGARGGKSGR